MPIKLLFVINPGSGNGNIDYENLIREHFSARTETIAIYQLPEKIDKNKLKKEIKRIKADRVIAVGGDGTVKLVAECLLKTNIPVGIVPAGSANGLAKELIVPDDPAEALDLAANGKPMQVHLVKINDEICIHLADLGFNAYLVKQFDAISGRGMWAYTKATWHALMNRKRMEVELKFKGKTVQSKAAMVAIANATRYGSGLKINPNGKLDDNLFEVILVKDYSYLEILKVWFIRLPFNPKKVEIFQTKALKITSKHKVHFQIDGEYLGKISDAKAKLLPAAIPIIAGPAFGETGS